MNILELSLVLGLLAFGLSLVGPLPYIDRAIKVFTIYNDLLNFGQARRRAGYWITVPLILPYSTEIRCHIK